MVDNSTILEFEFNRAERRRVKPVWLNLLVKLSAFIMLVVLTSYQLPNSANEKKVSYRFIDLQYEILTAVYSNADSILISSPLMQRQVQQFYTQKEFGSAWTDAFGANGQLTELISLLDSASYLGFPVDYFNTINLKTLTSQLATTGSLAARVNLELQATAAALRLMLYLNRGVNAESILTDSVVASMGVSYLLANALEADSLKPMVLALQPKLEKYNRIIASLPNFIDMHLSVKHTTPKFIDDNMLAKAFYTAGLSDFTYIDSSQNSKQLIARVQSKLGLTVDSTLNAQTHEVLVSMLQYRYFQACLNINRLRQMNGLEGSFLFVNIPEFKLHVIDSMKELETFRVIVGKAETPTPVFSGKIDRVVTNPYWTVPKSIVAKMLHKIRSDSTYLTRNGYYVINSFEQKVDSKEIDWSNPDPLGNRYALRQRNSTSNALGLIKFLFPNDYSVYIHDTPSRNLFNHEVRTFSHGCIRLENPDKLAQYITDRFVEDELNIQQLISNRSTTDIELSNQLDVHIQYITCTAAEDRNMQFFADIYNRDKQEIMSTFPGLLEI